MATTHNARTKADCYDYVRRTYGVPAFVGVRVRFAGGKEGVLVPARSDLHYVHVRLDGQKFAVLAHPADVEYLIGAAGQSGGSGSHTTWGAH